MISPVESAPPSLGASAPFHSEPRPERSVSRVEDPAGGGVGALSTCGTMGIHREEYRRPFGRKIGAHRVRGRECGRHGVRFDRRRAGRGRGGAACRPRDVQNEELCGPVRTEPEDRGERADRSFESAVVQGGLGTEGRREQACGRVAEVRLRVVWEQGNLRSNNDFEDQRRTESLVTRSYIANMRVDRQRDYPGATNKSPARLVYQ